MGVPRLFKFIVETFPEYFIHFYKGEYESSVDYLYLDANGLLHKAAQIVFNYGQMERNLNKYQNLSEEIKRKKVYALFFETILQVTKIIKPKKVLYIAIDGTAPLSKQAQQRQRRFVAAKTRMEEENSTGKNRFDSNCITPGTVFMHDLSRYIQYAIRKEMNEYPDWKGLEVYFSPPTIPSEGEHKILDFIRELPEKEKMEASHCLFGPDGDLIMLTLAAHIPHMFLFREDLYNSEAYHYLDMGAIREKLPEVLGQKGKRTLDEVTDDFIAEGFFVGNDFLPKIQMFYLLEDGLETMMDVYSRTSNHGQDNFLTENNKLNLKGFSKFVSELSKNEIDYLEKQTVVEIRDNRFINHTLLKHMNSGKLDFEKYKKDYYKKALKGVYVSKCSEKELVNSICRDYLKSFIWVLEYYIKGLPSWEWSYKWHYAPLMGDFSSFLNNMSNKEFEEISCFENDKAPLPFVQLLSVLPPPSSKLLPTSYRHLMSKEGNLYIKGYYPSTFEIDYESKTQEYQGIALLPFVDYSLVNREYSNVKTKEYLRNKIGKISVFRYDPSYNASFTSDMGNVNNLHVRKRTIEPHRY
jgi:5'-3' exoribonuclease 1